MSVSRIITGGSLLLMCKSESNGEIGEKKTINDMTIMIVFFYLRVESFIVQITCNYMSECRYKVG